MHIRISGSRLFGIAISCIPFAAIPSLSAAQLATPATFAAEPYVVNSLSSITSMNADGTGTRRQTLSIKIQSDAALRQFGVISLTFSSQSERAEIVYARVLRPDGTMVETPVKDAIEQPAAVTREAPFYSDLKTTELPVKSLRMGDTLQWQMLFTVTHPEIPGQFWAQETFISGAVVLEELHELRVPATLHPTVWTNSHEAASHSDSTENGQHIDRWRHTDLHPTVGPEADKARKAEETHVATPDEELDATKGKLPSIAWTTFPDWAAVGAWYRTLTANRTQPDAAIQAKVAEIIASKANPQEKAQAIYTFVSTQIRYIGVAFGIGRYQPHTAAEVFANQYGDCKDKYVLLASMLQVAGLASEPVLIGAGIRFNPAVPSPAAFNHLIARLPLAAGTAWLDSTAEVAPWGALVFAVRDHEALAIPAIGPATIVRTPTALPYPPYALASVKGTLDKALTSDSTAVFTLRDDDEILIRSILRTVPPSNYGTFVQQLMQNMGFGGTTSEPAFQHLDDSSQPLVLSFHYHRVKETDWGENRITVIFAPSSLPFFPPQKPPTATIQLGPLHTQTSTVEMELPTGWSAELPEAVHAHWPFATCDVTYRLSAGKLFAERRIAVLQTMVPLNLYKQYEDWYTQAGVSGVPYVQLIPANIHADTGTMLKPEPPTRLTMDVPPTPPSNPKAAELVEKAGESIRSMDPDAARKLLDQAKAINPSERGLWMGYAAVAGQFGKGFEAVEDLRTEISYHPEESRVYRYISMEQHRIGDSTAALATLRKWTAAIPSDPDAALALAQELNLSGKHEDALRETQAAIARLDPPPTNLNALRFEVARAQAGLGHQSEAAATAQPLLALATDPNEVSGIAYLLAEAGANLPEVEAAMRKALAGMEADTTGWTLSETPLLLMRKQPPIVAAWDTLGYVLFREGKYNDALGYLTAAAHNSDHPAVRDHFAAVSKALQKPGTPAPALKNDQALRTFPLGPARGQHGTAQFRMLIVNGTVVSVGPPAPSPYAPPSATSPTGSTPGLPNAEDRLKSADLHALFPPGSPAHLVRTGVVNCHNTVCELVLYPLGTN